MNKNITANVKPLNTYTSFLKIPLFITGFFSLITAHASPAVAGIAAALEPVRDQDPNYYLCHLTQSNYDYIKLLAEAREIRLTVASPVQPSIAITIIALIITVLASVALVKMALKHKKEASQTLRNVLITIGLITSVVVPCATYTLTKETPSQADIKNEKLQALKIKAQKMEPLPVEIYDRCKLNSRHVSYTVGEVTDKSYYVINPQEIKQNQASTTH